jgi:hypothetical protein
MNLLAISHGDLTIFIDETLDSLHAEGATVITCSLTANVPRLLSGPEIVGIWPSTANYSSDVRTGRPSNV